MYEAFKIGVSIGLINNASLGLAALSKDFSKAEAQASLLQKRIDALQNLGKIGSSMMSFSSSINIMLKAPYEAAKASERQRQKITASKLSPADHARIFPPAHMLALNAPAAVTHAKAYLGSMIKSHTNKHGKSSTSTPGVWSEAASLLFGHLPAAGAKTARHRRSSAQPKSGLLAKHQNTAAQHPDGFIQSIIAPRFREQFGLSRSDEHLAGSTARKRGSRAHGSADSPIAHGQEYSRHAAAKQKRQTASGVSAHTIKMQKGGKAQAAAPGQNFLGALNGLQLPAITTSLQQFSDALSNLSPIVEKHPALVKALAYSLTTLQTAMTLGENVLNAISTFRDLAGTLGKIGAAASKLTKLGDIGTSIAKLASAGGKVGRAFSLLGSGLTMLRGVASIVSVSLRVLSIAGRALVATPIGLVIMAIAAAAYLLWRNWGTIGPILTATWNTIKTSFENFVGGLLGIWNKLTSLLPSWMHHDDAATAPTTSGAAAHDAAVTPAASKAKSQLPAGLLHAKKKPLSDHPAAKRTTPATVTRIASKAKPLLPVGSQQRKTKSLSDHPAAKRSTPATAARAASKTAPLSAHLAATSTTAATPVPTASQATASQSPFVRGAAQQAVLVDAKLYLTRTGQTEIAKSTAQIISTGIARPMGSGTFDTGLHALTPAMA